MARTISTRLAIEGEAQYKQAVASCNSELATLKSSLALVESEFRGNANSMEALTAKGTALESMYQKQLEKVVTLEAALLNAKGAQEEYSSRVSTAQDNIQRCEQALEKLRQSTGDTSKEQEELTRELDKWNTELVNAQAGQTAAERGIQNWQKQLNNAKIELNGLSDRIEQNNQYLREAEASADGCAQSIDRYGKEVKEAGESSGQFAQGAEQSRQGIEQLASALAAAGIAKTVKEITDELLACAGAAAGFETALAKLSTLMVPHSMEYIKAKLMDLSRETGVAAGALAEAAYQARSAGVDAANVIDFVATATKTSVAGFTDSATAVNVLTTAINAYKMEGSEAERVASMLVKTQDEGKTSVGELAQNMGRIIPVSAAYNVSLENLTTAYALLTKSGTNTAISTTNLSAMFTELAKDGSNVADILEEKTGKSFSELMAGGQNLGGIMEILSDSVGGNATAFSNLWSSTTAGQAALSLLNSGADEFNRTLAVMENSSGAVERNFQTMANTTEFAQQRMTNAAENLRIAIGDQLNPALEKLYDTGAEAFTWATDFVEENPWLVQAVAGAAGAVGLLTVGFAAYIAVTTAAKAAQDALNISMGLCPIVAVTAAVGALAFMIGSWVASLDDADKSTREFTDSLKETKAAYEDLASAMKDQQTDAASTAAALKDLLAVEEKSTVQKDSILRLVEDLNEAVPGLGLSYDAAADSINMTVEAMDAMLERAAGQETYNAQMDRLSQLYVERTEIATRLKEAEDNLTIAQGENIEQLPGYFDIAADYNNALAVSSVAAGELDNNIRDLTAAQAANAAEIAELEEATNAYAGQQAEAAKKTGDMEARVNELTTQMAELQAAYDESYNAAMTSLESQMGLFEEMDGKAKTSIDSLIKTLTGQVEYMEAYAANIQKAMEMGVDEGLVRKLSDGSEESAQILAAIVEGGEEDIAALNEQLAKVEEGKTAFSETVAEMETDFSNQMTAIVQDLDDAIQSMDLEDDAYTIGANNIQGLINGTVSKKRDLINEYIQMGYDALAAYKRAVGQHSPSKEFEKAGSFDMEGLAIGMKNSSGKVMETVEDVASEALSRLNDFLGDVDHAIFLAEKSGAAASADIIDAYRAMQQKIHETADWFRAQGYSETSDEIQKLQKLWWDYADSIEAAQKKANKSVADDFSDFIGDMEHEMFLAQKHGTDTLEYIVSAYREMQQKVHEMAEYYRNLGYAETSDEIQKYQKLWWEYADNIAAAQEAAGKSAIDAFDKEVSGAKSRISVLDLEYQLWEGSDGKLASAMEKYEKQQELLNEKIVEQWAAVEGAEARYQEAVEQYGEAVEASVRYKEALLEEKLALQDLQNQLEKTTEAKQELAMQNSLKQIEYNWMTSGLGIASAAAERTGNYDPYEFARIAGIGVAAPGGSDEAADMIRYSQARHLPATLEEPRTEKIFERRMEEFTAGTVNAIASLGQSGGGTGVKTVNLVVNGKTFASATFDDFTDYGDANGTPIIKRK